MLGCGRNVASVWTKCGGQKLMDLPATSDIHWNRTLDGTSWSTVTVPVESGCCGQLGDLGTWGHHLMVHRDGQQVWAGPLTSLRYRRGDAVFRAQDVSVWPERRVLHSTLDEPAEATLTGLRIVEDALVHPTAVPDDTCIGRYLTRIPGDVTVHVELDQYSDTSGAALRQLANGPISFTVLGYRMIIFGPRPLGVLGAILRDQHILDDIEVVEDGMLSATRVIVVGDGVIGIAGGDEPFYGLLERLIKDDTIVDEETAFAVAQAELQASRPPSILVDVPQNARLAPETPVQINDLVPGMIVPLVTSSTCREVSTGLWLLGVTVDQDANGERVAITLGAGIGDLLEQGRLPPSDADDDDGEGEG